MVVDDFSSGIGNRSLDGRLGSPVKDDLHTCGRVADGVNGPEVTCDEVDGIDDRFMAGELAPERLSEMRISPAPQR